MCAGPNDGTVDARVASMGVLGSDVRLGLLLSGQHPAGDSAAGAVGQHLEQVDVARELDFSSVWTSQHFLSHPFLYLQSVPLLARVAAAAEGMTVGTAILLLTLLNPVEVAQNARPERPRLRTSGQPSPDLALPPASQCLYGRCQGFRDGRVGVVARARC